MNTQNLAPVATSGITNLSAEPSASVSLRHRVLSCGSSTLTAAPYSGVSRYLVTTRCSRTSTPATGFTPATGTATTRLRAIHGSVLAAVPAGNAVNPCGAMVPTMTLATMANPFTPITTWFDGAKHEHQRLKERSLL